MEYRKLGQSGLSVSAVSLGSWLTIGNVVGQRESEGLVQAAIDHGVNLLDTADVYNRGEAERALGKLMGGLVRHHVVIATKCFFPMSDDVNDRGLSRKHLVESLEHSLRRLRTDYVDLYQCHRPDPGTPLEETCRAMDDLIRQGKALYWGVSMWPGWMIVRAVELCRREGFARPISNQPCYNLLDRSIEAEVLPASAEVGVGQIVFSPLAQGVLTGKYRVGETPDVGTRAADDRVNRFIPRFMAPENLRRVEQLVVLATELGTTTARLALAWCLRRDEVASVICGATRVEQLADNVAAAGMSLDAEVEERLDALFGV